MQVVTSYLLEASHIPLSRVDLARDTHFVDARHVRLLLTCELDALTVCDALWQ
jgi:hypothetical protein